MRSRPNVDYGAAAARLSTLPRVSLLEAIILGVVQELTEFLPISSTAHLRLVPAFVGWEAPSTAFTAVTQLGTLAAVLLYFRRDLALPARVGERRRTERAKAPGRRPSTPRHRVAGTEGISLVDPGQGRRSGMHVPAFGERTRRTLPCP